MSKDFWMGLAIGWITALIFAFAIGFFAEMYLPK